MLIFPNIFSPSFFRTTFQALIVMAVFLSTTTITFAESPASVSPALFPKSVETTSKIPADAIVIFDGKNTDQLVTPTGEKCNWIVKNGELICQPPKGTKHQSLWTKLHFCDAQVHVEFLIPKSEAKGESAGNSGLYFHGLFELQILDSYKKTGAKPDRMLGAVYKIKAPLVNAARPVEKWQTYDVIYKAPRRNAKGEPIEKGSITAMLNHVLVQSETPILKTVSKYSRLHFRTTPYADKIRESLYKTEAGPLQLQDHQNPVRFRNIWIRPLDDKSFQFSPQLGADKK